MNLKLKRLPDFHSTSKAWEIINEKQFVAFIAGGYKLVALETCEGSKNIFETELPEKIILLGGNESHGLPDEIFKTQ